MPQSSQPDPDVTALLVEWGEGSEEALEKLIPLVYRDLRRLAGEYLRRERRGHTLQPTALVNEVFVRLMGQDRTEWESRAQFFGVAAQMMRRILVDHARRKRAQKRGGGVEKLPFDESRGPLPKTPFDLVALDDALLSLAAIDPRQSRIVELRYFVGLSNEEIARLLEVSPATVLRDWRTAKAFLGRELSKR